MVLSNPIRFAATLCLLFTCSAVAGTVSGTVYLSEKGSWQPSSGVRIVARSTQKMEVFRSVKTKNDGSYVIADLPRVSILLSIVKPGYVVRSRANGKLNLKIDLTESPGTVDGIDFFLLPGGVISGRVTDGAWEPLEGVPVELQRLADSGTADSTSVRVITDDRGNYRAFGLEPGRYIVRARLPDGRSGATYYPGSANKEDAEPVRVGSGEEVLGMDLRLETAFTDSSGSTTPIPGQAPRANTESVTPDTPTAEPHDSISGEVVSAQTGQTLRGARVTISSLRQDGLFTQSTTTGPQGEFFFEHLLPGAYGLYSEKAGFESRNLSGQVMIAEDQSRTGVAIKLNRSPVISGRVTDRNGQPKIGATVEAYWLRFVNDRLIANEVASSTTDDRGMYRLARLTPGRYVVSASTSPSADELPRGTIDLGTTLTFYPAAGGPNEAVPLSIRYGQELSEINLTLIPRQTFSVSGSVTDQETGGPCRSCVIRVIPQDELYGLSQPDSIVAMDGTYQARGLTPGNYRIVVEKSLGDRFLTSYRTIRIADRNLTDVHVLGGVAHGITGHVVFEPESLQLRSEIAMEVVFRTPEGVGAIESTSVDHDGSFTATSLSCLTCRVQLNGLPPGGFVKALRMENQPLPGLEFEVPQEAGSESLEIVVSLDSATLAGQLKTGEGTGQGRPRVEAALLLFPSENQPPYVTNRRAVIRPDGVFSLAGIPPGSYTVFAVQRNTQLDWNTPEVREQMGRYGKRITLEAGRQTMLDVTLVPEDFQ